MKTRATWGVAGLVLGLATAISIPSFAQTSPTAPPSSGIERTVTASGVATIRSSPDEAVVMLGVQTQAASAEAASQENATKMSGVIDALVASGVGRDDISTAWVNLWPTYGQSGTTVTGYTAENQVSVTIHEMARIGRVIDRAVEAGANLASGITFQLSDENEGVQQALEAAVADARSKAQVLAAAADASLGQVITISEVGTPSYPPLYYDRVPMAGAEASVSTPVEPPTLETQVSVMVVWGLG